MKVAVSLALSGVMFSTAFAISVAPPAEASTKPVFSTEKKDKLKGKVQKDLMEADELMGKGSFSDAADAYQKVISKNAKNADAVAGYGMALGKQFKLDAAQEQFDKALSLDPSNAVAHIGKAMVLLNRLNSSSTTIQRQRDSILKQAEAECRQALQKDPYSPEGHYQLAQSLKEQGRLDEATSEYNEALKSDPQYSDALAGLGLVKLAQNSLAEAASAFKQAIQYRSTNSTAHYGLGKTYLKQGLLDDAIKELNTAMYQNPNSWPTHLAMGEAYMGQGNNVAAVKEFQKSIQIKAENPEAYLRIADVREMRGDVELSISELRAATELMPDNPDLHMKIADQSLEIEKLDDAIKEYQNVMNMSPNNSMAAQGLTRAYYLKAQKESAGAFFVSNDFEDAKRQIEKAIALNPNDMELRLALAKMRSLSGEQVDLSTIGTPSTDGERVAYAEALLAQNRFTEAQQQMNTVIANASNAKQTFAVADLALMIKDLDSAEAAYRKAASFPGAQERSSRGLGLVAKARDAARQDYTLATDLSKRKQLASAMDKYHQSIYENPKVADSRWGLAQTLEKMKPEASKYLREAIVQYKAYMSLSPQLPPKETEKLTKKIANLEEKAFKLEQKEKKQK